jgi:hypothetical protein
MKLNETVFNYGFGIATLGVIFWLIAGGSVDLNTIVGMFGNIGFNVAFFLAVVFGLQKFQMGTDYDVQNKIFEEANLAVAIYQGFLFLALSIVISKGV